MYGGCLSNIAFDYNVIKILWCFKPVMIDHDWRSLAKFSSAALVPCGPPSCIVHHQSILCTMVHKGDSFWDGIPLSIVLHHNGTELPRGPPSCIVHHFVPTRWCIRWPWVFTRDRHDSGAQCSSVCLSGRARMLLWDAKVVIWPLVRCKPTCGV